MPRYPLRHREDFVRPLTPGLQVSPSSGMVDRAEVSFGNWELPGTIQEVTQGLNQLRNFPFHTHDDREIPLFRHGQVDGRRLHPEVYFDSGTEEDDRITGERPLISGRISWVPRRSIPVDQRSEHKQLRFDATVNITRFIQAQVTRPVRSDDGIRLRHIPTLVMSPREHWYREEAPLVPSTNVIAGSVLKYSEALRRPASEHFTRLMALWTAQLDHSVCWAFSELPSTPVQHPNFSLREIEYYWEFDSENAIDFVQAIARPMSSLSGTIYVGGERVRLPEHTVEFQSPSVKVVLARDVTLKAYAKTLQRVRFEVTFGKRGIEDSLGRRRVSPRRTATGIEELAEKVAVLQSAATDYFNEALPRILPSKPPESTLEVMDLLTRIGVCADGDARIAETIASALANFGRVEPYANDPIYPAVSRLRRTHVLESVRRRSRVNVVTAPIPLSLAPTATTARSY